MTFLTSSFALLAAAIAVPTLVILYFLKLRRRDVEVSTTLLWKKAIQDLQANAPFQRLRRNILLLLQLLGLGAVLFALGQPMIKGQVLHGNRMVLLIDRSGSMSATDAIDSSGKSLTRLELAKQQAIALVDSMRDGGAFFNQGSGDEAMVIAFDNQAEPLQPFTNNKQALRAAIESIQPTDKTTSVDEAVRVAIAHLPKRILPETGKEIEGLTSGDPVTLHLFTDGRIPDSDKARPGPENRVVYHSVGDRNAKNLAITALKAEREFEQAEKLSIFVSVQNTDTRARSVDVELLIDGQVAGIKPLTINAATTSDLSMSTAESARAAAREKEAADVTGARVQEGGSSHQQLARPGTGGVVFKLDRTLGALAQVRLRDPGTGGAPEGDVLASDNRAWLAVPPARQISVVLVGRPNLFIKAALEGLPLARFDEMTKSQFEQAWREGKAGQYDVVILDGVIPDVGQRAIVESAPQGSGDQAPTLAPIGSGETLPLPPGKFLVLGAVPGSSGLIVEGETKNVSILDWSRDHPSTRYLVLDPLTIATFRKIRVEPGRGVHVIANADSGPAILEQVKGDTHAVIVPFDYMESTWPIDLSFVVFMASSVQYLGREVSGGYDARALRPGSELRDRLPTGVTKATVRAPDARGGSVTQDLTPGADGTIIYRTPPVSGVIEVTWKGASSPSDVRDPSSDTVLRVYASNLLDSSESDVAAVEQVEMATTTVTAQAERSTQADKRLWPYLLLGALGVLLLEWYVYNRKVHV